MKSEEFIKKLKTGSLELGTKEISKILGSIYESLEDLNEYESKNSKNVVKHLKYVLENKEHLVEVNNDIIQIKEQFSKLEKLVLVTNTLVHRRSELDDKRYKAIKEKLNE